MTHRCVASYNCATQQLRTFSTLLFLCIIIIIIIYSFLFGDAYMRVYSYRYRMRRKEMKITHKVSGLKSQSSKTTFLSAGVSYYKRYTTGYIPVKTNRCTSCSFKTTIIFNNSINNI